MKINLDDVIIYKHIYKKTCENIKNANGVCSPLWCHRETCPFCYAECEEEQDSLSILNLVKAYLELFCREDDTFKLGEEVEIKIFAYSPLEKAKIGAVLSDNRVSTRPILIRKAPKLEPMDGEPVLFNDEGKAMAGFIKGGILFARGLMIADWKISREVAPFTNDRDVGKPWQEIVIKNK